MSAYNGEQAGERLLGVQESNEVPQLIYISFGVIFV